MVTWTVSVTAERSSRPPRRQYPKKPITVDIDCAYVDEKAINYAVDRLMGGLYILELTF